IGIGAANNWPVPCHTTRHAGPHRAVGTVEVIAPNPAYLACSHLYSTRSIEFFAVMLAAGFTLACH
ncbi:hypothetical protein, partial [Herminiimonas sp. CN]|uniref:hypothetical protein n=1 Tax=Herminiimonas sp. CN TaxID=1349818 RepID=UPI0005522D54